MINSTISSLMFSTYIHLHHNLSNLTRGRKWYPVWFSKQWCKPGSDL